MPDLSNTRIIDLMTGVLTIEARLAALGEHGAAIRRELTRRGVETVERDGVAPTWRAPEQLGSVSFRNPERKPRLLPGSEARAEFASWVAERYPTEVTAAVSVPAELLTAVLEILESPPAQQLLQGWHPTADLEVNPTWLRAFLEREVTVLDDETICDSTGEIVPGLANLRSGEPGVSVRLNPEAKVRAAAELGDLLPAILQQSAATTEVEAGEAEPEYNAPPVDHTGSEDPWGTTQEPVLEAVMRDDLSKLRVDELRAIARQLHLPANGRKAELITRITDYRNAHTETRTKASR